MNTDQNEIEAFILLGRLSLTGAKAIHHELLSGVSAVERVRKIEAENFLNKAEALQELRGKFDPAREIEKISAIGGRIVSILDEEYPFLLKQISDPPLVLYIKGTLFENDKIAAAIVGTRHPSVYGIQQTQRFSGELARSGLTIVSGFAKGVDQWAHQAALKIPYGRTLAVLGCGLDVEYPKESRKLFEAVVEQGAVISEYAMGTPPLAENFPKRNRIIAGLALGTLVVEAHAISGSLITARLAMEEGREVFSVPGPLNQLTSRGTNQLIKEGATLADSPEEMAEVLVSTAQKYRWIIPEPQTLANGKQSPNPSAPMPEAAPRVDFSFKTTADGALEEERLLDPLGKENLSPEELAQSLALPEGNFGALLTLLEIQGRIKRLPDGRYALTKTEV